ncbi:MAG: fructose-bisphosphatase class III [Firmicutes bacterium]|nr:fructose-bisphosphatase class III [Bacillota bacterium]
MADFLSKAEALYILGDILDRGPHPIKVLRKLMEMPNAVPIAGNHELMP